MAINYPTSLDNGTSLPSPSATDDTDSPSLSSGQSLQNDAVIAVETKLGITSSTPTSGMLLRSTADGESTWDLAYPTGAIVGLSDTQTLTNKTLTSPTINGGTISNPTLDVDAVVGYTTSDDGTVYGMSVSGGVLASAAIAGAVNTAALQSGAVTYAKVASGFAIQVAQSVSTTTSTSTATYSNSSTPTTSGGVQVVSVSITPSSTTTTLVIEANAQIASAATANNFIFAIFQSGSTSAIASGKVRTSAAGALMPCPLSTTMTSGTTSAITFSFRVGVQSADTLTINGEGGSAILGGTVASSIIVTEYKS